MKIGNRTNRTGTAARLRDAATLLGRCGPWRTAGAAFASVLSAALETAGTGVILGYVGAVTGADGRARQVRAFLGDVAGTTSDAAFAAAAGGAVVAFYLAKNAVAVAADSAVAGLVEERHARAAREAARAEARTDFGAWSADARGGARERMDDLDEAFGSCILPGVQAISDGTVAVLLVCALAAVDPVLALVAVTSLGVVGGSAMRWTKRTAAREADARREASRLALRRLDALARILPEARVLGREDDLVARYSADKERASRHAARARVLQRAPRLVTETAFAVTVVGCVVAVTARGDAPADAAATLAAFAFVGLRVSNAVSRATAGAQVAAGGAPALARAARAHRTAGSGPQPDRGTFSRGVPGDIVLDGVRAGYGGPDILRGISLDIPRGRTTVLTGPSGAGKSTAARIVAGVLRPESGRVLAGGIDVFDDPASWRTRCAWVPQEPAILEGSVRHNVTLADDGNANDGDADDAGVRDALRAAGADDFVDGLPGGLDHHVSDRGHGISGGQAQRIAIARAVHARPDVLVLDEATSALDEATEARVLDALAAGNAAPTVLMVTHRPAPVEHADVVHRIEDGIVVSRTPGRSANASSHEPQHVEDS